MSTGHELEKLRGRDCRDNKARHTKYNSLWCYDSKLIQTDRVP